MLLKKDIVTIVQHNIHYIGGTHGYSLKSNVKHKGRLLLYWNVPILQNRLPYTSSILWLTLTAIVKQRNQFLIYNNID